MSAFEPDKTHPFISFQFNAERLSPYTWLLLGEASSKCEHIAGSPLSPSFAQSLHLIYLAKGASATTAIEGNTLTEDEVREHFEGKLSLPASRAYLAQENENIRQAWGYITKWVTSVEGHIPLTPDTLKDLNSRVLENVPVEEWVVPGEYRQHDVRVGGYKPPAWQDCPKLIEHFCEFINNFPKADGYDLPFALLKAVIAHVYFVWIHPFGDGNGRTARLIESMILLSAGVPSPACHLLSNFYNQTRTEYIRALDKAAIANGIYDFPLYALRGFVDELREQVIKIRFYQWDVVWENHVHKSFAGKDKTTDKRRRDLVLALSAQENPVPTNKLIDLSPQVARAYANTTHRVLQKDLQELARMELIRLLHQEGQKSLGVVAAKGKILSLLPPFKITPI